MRTLRGLLKFADALPLLTRSDMRQIRNAFSDFYKEWQEVGSFADWDRRKEFVGPRAIVDFANRILKPEQIANYTGPNPLYRNGVPLTDDELTHVKSVASNYIKNVKKPTLVAQTTTVKKAQAYDKNKWPDYDEYQKKRHDKVVEIVRKLVEEHYSKQHPWGLKLDNNRFATWGDLRTDTKDDILKHAIIRDGNKIMRQRRGVCHDLVAARMKMLKDKGIDAHRLFVDYGKDVDTDSILGHSMVYFSGDDGKLHIASPSMRDRPRKNFGSFDDLNDAVIQYIAAIKDSKKLTDDDFVEIHDTTDVPFKDIETWDNYRKKALKGKLLYSQGR